MRQRRPLRRATPRPLSWRRPAPNPARAPPRPTRISGAAAPGTCRSACRRNLPRFAGIARQDADLPSTLLDDLRNVAEIVDPHWFPGALTLHLETPLKPLVSPSVRALPQSAVSNFAATKCRRLRRPCQGNVSEPPAHPPLEGHEFPELVETPQLMRRRRHLGYGLDHRGIDDS
jgi:hypothetical protein